MSWIVFFIGILLAVATLSSLRHADVAGPVAGREIGNQSIIVILIGLVTAVVDNMPLVAASMGMYALATFPTDSFIWEFMAYCAGTGGSILIIGSAAGVAAMGLEKIEFFWYARKIGPLALLGYFAGIVCLYRAVQYVPLTPLPPEAACCTPLSPLPVGCNRKRRPGAFFWADVPLDANPQQSL